MWRWTIEEDSLPRSSKLFHRSCWGTLFRTLKILWPKKFHQVRLVWKLCLRIRVAGRKNILFRISYRVFLKRGGGFFVQFLMQINYFTCIKFLKLFHFWSLLSFYTPLQTPERQRFSGICAGFKIGILAGNGLRYDYTQP